MASQKETTTKEARSTRQVRISISIPADVYETIENIAKEKKVSLAWVVREAVDTYLGERWPLFRERE